VRERSKNEGKRDISQYKGEKENGEKLTLISTRNFERVSKKKVIEQALVMNKKGNQKRLPPVRPTMAVIRGVFKKSLSYKGIEKRTARGTLEKGTGSHSGK